MASSENPLVCYIIVRGSLGMSAGKCCAQCSHAVQHLFEHYFTVLLLEQKIHSETKEHPHIILMTQWLKDGSRKVVLEATDEQWSQLKTDYGKGCLVVRDAGLTEVKEGSETAMALWPDLKSNASNGIKQMRALK